MENIEENKTASVSQLRQSNGDIKNVNVNNSNKSCMKKDSQSQLKRGVSIKEDKKKWKLVPPDGGWGWLVLWGAFLVNIIVPGNVKSFGILFVEFMEMYKPKKTVAAIIPALCYFLYSSLGPLSGILSLKYSYKTVSLIGGFCAALGMITSSWTQSIFYLFISYGVLVGTGAGLAFPPTVYIVTSYFYKKRGLANGICISGSAFGSIILPPLLNYLVGEYGTRGTILIMGAITLNTWVAAQFFDPVEKHMKKVPNENTEEEENEELEDANLAKYVGTIDNTASLQLLQTGNSFLENQDVFNDSFARSFSSAAVPGYKEHPDNRERKISVPSSKEISRLRINQCDSKGQLYQSGTLEAVPEKMNSASFQSQPKITSTRTRSSFPRRNASTSSFQYISTPFHGSTLNLQPEQFASSFSLRSVTSKGAAKDSNLSSQAPVVKQKLFDLSLLADPIYLIILISNSTNAISYTNFFIYLPDYINNRGYAKSVGSSLLSIVSAFDLVGRIGGSTLSDISSFPKEYYFVGGLLVSGISLAALPSSNSYTTLVTLCAIFGLSSGTYVGITTIIMADLLGTDKIQSSYGISLFVNGVLQFVGPIVCATFIDSKARYSSLFFSLGIILILGSALWICLPFIKRSRNKKPAKIFTEAEITKLRIDEEQC